MLNVDTKKSNVIINSGYSIIDFDIYERRDILFIISENGLLVKYLKENKEPLDISMGIIQKKEVEKLFAISINKEKNYLLLGSYSQNNQNNFYISLWKINPDHNNNSTTKNITPMLKNLHKITKSFSPNINIPKNIAAYPLFLDISLKNNSGFQMITIFNRIDGDTYLYKIEKKKSVTQDISVIQDKPLNKIHKSKTICNIDYIIGKSSWQNTIYSWSNEKKLGIIYLQTFPLNNE